MSAQVKRKYTLEEYFELERKSEERFEYFQGEIFAMSGASPTHTRIQGNIYFALRSKLRDKNCEVFLADLRVKVPSAPPFRYPDLSALCGEPKFEEIGGLQALTNPSLIIEVLSPTTEIYDRTEKFRHYKSIESFTEHLLVAQDRPHVTQFIRHENGFWLQAEFNSLDETIKLTSLDCVLTMQEIFQDVEFPPPAQNSLASEDLR